MKRGREGAIRAGGFARLREGWRGSKRDSVVGNVRKDGWVDSSFGQGGKDLFNVDVVVRLRIRWDILFVNIMRVIA